MTGKVYRKNSKYWDIYFWTNSVDSDQTALKEHSDQDLHCLPFCLHVWGHYCIVKSNCFILTTTTVVSLGVPIFKVFTVSWNVHFVLPQLLASSLSKSNARAKIHNSFLTSTCISNWDWRFTLSFHSSVIAVSVGIFPLIAHPAIFVSLRFCPKVSAFQFLSVFYAGFRPPALSVLLILPVEERSPRHTFHKNLPYLKETENTFQYTCFHLSPCHL